MGGTTLSAHNATTEIFGKTPDYLFKKLKLQNCVF